MGRAKHAFDVVRVNPEIGTVTLMLDVGGVRLQQDVEVPEFTEDAVKAAAVAPLAKFAADLDVAAQRDAALDEFAIALEGMSFSVAAPAISAERKALTKADAHAAMLAEQRADDSEGT
jgi:hypothetical protein